MKDWPIDRWEELRKSGEGDGNLEIPSLSSGVETGFGPARFAIGPAGQPRLLVPCGPGANLSNARMSANLIVTLSRLVHAGRGAMFIDLMSANSKLDPVFGELANEVLHRISDGTSPTTAVEGTITDFRDLLREESAEEVRDEQILGLIGELYVLRLLTRLNPGAAHSWTGPFDQRHDFRRGDDALEVKTSGRADATQVTISSVEQLASPNDGSLCLAHLRVERSNSGELSVGKLTLDTDATGAPMPLVEQALRAMGCADAQSPAWNRITYSFEGIAFYRVEAGFPRIVAADFPGNTLPHGVTSLSYAVDLRSAGSYLLPENQTNEVLRKVSG